MQLEVFMKNYDVYHGHEAVKHGFSWPGFFFGGLWALSHRLWLHSVIIFIVVIAGSYSAAILDNQGNQTVALLLRIAVIGVFITVGAYGNSWRVNALLRRRYTFINTTPADRAAAAIDAASGAGKS